MAEPLLRLKYPGKICVALGVLVLAVFFQVQNFDFVNFDDDIYVSGNPHIRKGITREGVRWAFSADLFYDSPYADYWQPVTFLSRMADVQLFGMSPAGHHGMNLIYHLLNVLLLFLLLGTMTGCVWRSALVAALFAVHPLQTEPVAWVTARKDLLGAFWGFLAIAAYLYFLRKKSPRRMFLTVLAFSMSLMSKAFWVTLPLSLLLLDLWPLKRMKKGRISEAGSWAGLIAEKWPLFLAATVFSFIPFIGQPKALNYAPFVTIFSKVLSSYVFYLGKFIWPSGLGIYGPAPDTVLPLWQYAGAALFLSSVTVLAILQARKKTYLMFGWSWFLIVLLPSACMALPADRFMMIPMIGLLAAGVWGGADVLMKWEKGKIAGVILAGTLILMLSSLSWKQLGYWRNNKNLFERMIFVNPGNYVAHNNLGSYFSDHGNFEEAVRHCSEAVRINPKYANAYNNLGASLVREGRVEEALGYYEAALRIKPDFARAHYNIAETLKMSKADDALQHYLEALSIDPYYASAHYGLGEIYARQGRIYQALEHLTRAVEIKPELFEAQNSLGAMFAASGRHEEAIAHFSWAARLAPDYPQARNNLGISLAMLGRNVDALKFFEDAIRIKPDFAEAHFNLGVALARMGRPEQAKPHFETALRIKPDYDKAADYLARMRDEKYGAEKE